MARGKLTLKGARKRPWLEIRRIETERAQLSWQLRQLQELHDGPLEFVRDRVPSSGFYDVHRLRVHGEGLYRAYELLCPRDERTVTPELLQMLGDQALGCLWSDAGSWASHRIAFKSTDVKHEDWLALDQWLKDQGYRPKLWWNHSQAVRIQLDLRDGARFKQAAAAHMHYSQRQRLLSRTQQALS